MPLANNHREQLAKRLKADLELRFPTYTVTASTAATGEPILAVNDGSSDIAYLAVSKRTFDGFNVVAELSSSAAEGLPEHVTWLAVDSGESQLSTSQLVHAASKLGTSSLKLAFEASVDSSDVLDDSKIVAELVNDARNGASGQ